MQGESCFGASTEPSSALNNQVHEDLPAWDGLLQVYGALFLPVIFALLFELNLDAWVSARINYEVGHPITRS